MANKYIIHGATYCGDGTSPAEATSTGGVGALNSLIYFEGAAWPAPAVLAAGDTVYVRSKDAAGADIIRTSATAVNIGSAAATEASPITWVIDAGTVWPGVSGTITESTTAGAAGFTVRAYNNLIATNYNLVFKNTATSYGNAPFFITNAVCLTKDIKIDTSANTTPGGAGSNHQFKGGKHINLWIKQGQITYSLLQFGRDIDTVLISPKLEILGPLYFAATATAVIEAADSIQSRLSIYGGEVICSSEGLAVYRTTQYPFNLDIWGLKYPPTMTLSNATLFTQRVSVTANGNDGGLGNTYFDYFYTYSSRFDGYYPTLNAQLETSGSTPWSYSIYPYRTTKTNPAQVSVSKMWTQAGAAKTVTLEFLWPAGFSTPDSSTVWMTVQYTDNATGNKVTQTTLAYPAATLSVSTASWSATTYGPTLFSKYKMSLTTQSSIKQDTEVMVTFFSTPKSASANDIIMLCPDVVLS